MRLVQLGRALVVLVIAPFLTLTISVFTLFVGFVLRWNSKRIQMLPRLWGRIITQISGVRVRVEGLDKLDLDKPYIFAANHQSQFDIFALQGYLGIDFRWMAKQELFQVPVFGQAMRLGGYIEVNRTHGRQAIKSLDEAAKRIAGGISVVIFPEGTRSPNGVLMPFKAGGMVIAIKSGVPLVPVAIMGTHYILPKGRILIRSGDVRIKIGMPISTNNYELRQKHELAEKLHRAVADLLVSDSPQTSD